nr:Eco57I restriction-modification methylase domain-containing protein [Candidatus Njordarchaeota archaeon]
MKGSYDKEKAEIRKLVDNFARNENGYCKPGSSYNEAQVRKDFVEPLFGILGWDTQNEMGLPQNLREVVYEGRLGSDDESREKPDYAFRLAGRKKFFVETKKPSIVVEEDSKSAFQLRSYGWSAKLPISVLTNFRYLAVYDCRIAPHEEDNFRVCRWRLYSYREYEQNCEEIYELLSRESVYSGAFDRRFAEETPREGIPFDEYFLAQIDKWRKHLADDIFNENPDIGEDKLNYLVESFINRIVFLRICEDRDIEKYETLLQAASKGAREKLLAVFKDADRRYNSGIFDFRKDKLSLRVVISDDTLVEIIRDLYYPRSPYIFSVVESDILGQIYELFLTQRIVITGNDEVEVIRKPETAHNLGVIRTPRFVVEELVSRTVQPLLSDKNPLQISKLKFADIACGSGSFLLGIYSHLLNYHLDLYVNMRADEKVYRGEGDNWHLRFEEKKRILLDNIFGIDIDPSAVEVTKFSLLVRLLEDESAGSIDTYASSNVLPSLEDNIKCGNSLIDSSFFRFRKASELTSKELDRLNVFDWDKAFRFNGGMQFDAIIVNPPYTRIQVMKKLFPLELEYYHQHYASGQTNNFDKYYLFIERALDRLSDKGLAAFIVPHKFMKIKAGEALRKMISQGRHLREIVHFGKEQVFEKSTTTYTCLLILSKSGQAEFRLELVKDLHGWKYSLANRSQISVDASEIGASPWLLIVGPLKLLVERLSKLHKRLSDMAEIFVGLQTSMDNVYVIKPKSISGNEVCFNDLEGRQWRIEKSITRPAIYDLEIAPFMHLKPNSLIIFPYFIKDGRVFAYDEEELQKEFPLTLKYLRKRRRLLEERDLGGSDGEKWYRYGRSQSLAKFDGRKKLIVKVLSLAPCFTYDDSNLCFTGGGNGPYYGVSLKPDEEVSIYFLQGLLNSKLIDLFVKSWSSVFRAGYYSYGKEYIEKLPMMSLDLKKDVDRQMHDRIVRVVQKLRHLEKRLEKIDIPAKRAMLISQMGSLEEELNETVYTLYCLSEDEKAYLRNLDLA